MDSDSRPFMMAFAGAIPAFAVPSRLAFAGDVSAGLVLSARHGGQLAPLRAPGAVGAPPTRHRRAPRCPWVVARGSRGWPGQNVPTRDFSAVAPAGCAV